MITVTDASRSPDAASVIMDRYSSESGSRITVGRDTRMFLANEDGRTVGFISFRNGRIGILYVTEDASDSVHESLLRSAMASAANEGRGSLSIHSADLNGRTERACRHLGFIEDGECTCCQRYGAVCMRKMF